MNFNINQVNPIWGNTATSIEDEVLYDFEKLEIVKLWTYYGIRGQGVNVYVIDSGVEADHLVFQHQKPKVKSFIPSLQDPTDKAGHGTWVAGKIGGDGIGLAPRCNLTCLRTLDDSGTGSVEFTTAALKWILNKEENPHIINMSLGSMVSTTAQEKLINELYDKGCLVVAAAGNMNSPNLFYPAAYQKTIAISALDRKESRANFSNYGTHIDLCAMGVSCYSSFLGNTYREMSGTSMATPIVTGIITLGMSYLLRKFPTLPKSRLREIVSDCLMSTTIDLGTAGKDIFYGFGELNSIAFMKKLETR
jgi:subtilisin family serine protease